MTEIFVPENPPLMETEDGRRMSEYIYRQLLNIRNEFDVPKVGRGGLTLTAPVVSSFLITQTPQKVTAFDAQILPALFVESDVTNGVIRILKTGLWYLAVKGIAQIVPHTSQTTRGYAIELYNETKAQTYKIIDFSSVSRHENITDYTISFPLYIPVSVLGDDFALYIYAVSTSADIQLTSLEILEFDFVLLDDLLVLA